MLVVMFWGGVVDVDVWCLVCWYNGISLEEFVFVLIMGVLVYDIF